MMSGSDCDRHLQAVVLDSLPAQVACLDAHGDYIFVNRAWAKWYGRAPQDFLERRVEDELEPAEIEELRPYIRGVINGQSQSFRRRARALDGKWHDFQVVLQPWPRPDDDAGYCIVATDITEATPLERLLADIVDGIDEAFVALDAEDRYIFFNRGAERLSGSSRSDVLGKSMWDTFPKARRPALAKALQEVRTTRQPIEQVVPSIVHDDMMVAMRMFPLNGRGIGLAVRDVTEKVRAEEMERILTREVDHRAKNLMAVVRSIARMTPFTTKEDYVRTLTERIVALSESMSVLSDHRWQHAPVATVVEAALAPFRGHDGARITVEGPEVHLEAAGVQPLSLILHELATNASKYGSLSRPEGRLSVTWALGSEELAIEWREIDGPLIEPPKQMNFGTTLIRTSAQQLAGSVEKDWNREGLVARIRIGRSVVAEPGRRGARTLDRREAS